MLYKIDGVFSSGDGRVPLLLSSATSDGKPHFHRDNHRHVVRHGRQCAEGCTQLIYFQLVTIATCSGVNVPEAG